MELKEIINNNKKHLDIIHEHTVYKVKYVTAYVKNWLEVAIHYSETKNINFIDCMCNAGVYSEGQLCTSTEVLKLFCEYAKQYSNIQFNLFVNDYNEDRVNIIKEVFKLCTDYELIKNVNVFFSTKDVNIYIDMLLDMKKYFSYEAHSFTILFVDPYRFGDVMIKKLNTFFNEYYAELIYNYFSSDYRRNIKNESAKEHKELMIKSMEQIKDFKPEMDANEVLDVLQNNFIAETKLKYTFVYPFHIRNNVQLYYIIYGTPHKKGIEKIKECIWSVFNGSDRHRTNPHPEQISIFSGEQEKEINARQYIENDAEKIYNVFKGKIVPFEDLEEFVLLNTMLNKSQIISGILKKMIADKKVIKQNIKGTKNYKDDLYKFL